MDNPLVMRIVLLLIIAGCAFGIITATAERPELTIRVAFLASIDDEDYIGAEAFKRVVEQRLGSRVSVQIFPSGQFCGSERECIEALQSGILEVHQTTVGGLAGLFGAAQVLDLPYVFRDDAIAECVVDGPIVREMGSEILGTGLGLRLMVVGNTGGWRSFATTRQRIAAIGDLRGLRIRTLPSAMEQEMVRELGANPMPLPWSEVYGALGAGLINGIKNSVQDVVGMKLNDHIRHLLVDRHSYMAAIWWYSEVGWQRLSAEQQEAVAAGFEALAIATRKAARERELPALAEFERRGGTVDVVTDAQREQFRAATVDLRQWYAARFDPRWLQRLDRDIARCEALHPPGASL